MRTELQEAVARRDVSILEMGSSPEGREHLHPETIRAGLEEAGARRLLAERLRADAAFDVAAWVRVADQAGLSPTEIARACGATRRAVYQWLESQ